MIFEEFANGDCHCYLQCCHSVQENADGACYQIFGRAKRLPSQCAHMCWSISNYLTHFSISIIFFQCRQDIVVSRICIQQDRIFAIAVVCMTWSEATHSTRFGAVTNLCHMHVKGACIVQSSHPLPQCLKCTGTKHCTKLLSIAMLKPRFPGLQCAQRCFCFTTTQTAADNLACK